jgi:hypothetical protein
MKGECLRCGKKFTKLNSHLKNKKLCPAKYLDITGRDMIENYDKFYVQYTKKINQKKCEVCQKEVSKHNYLRHLRTHSNENTQSVINTGPLVNNGTIETLVNGNVETLINGDQTTNINMLFNFSMNSLGNETNIDASDMYGLIYEHQNALNTLQPSNDIEYNDIFNNIIANFIENLHFGKEENMNVYIPANHDKNGHVYINNKWQCKSKKDIINMVLQNAAVKLDESKELIRKYLILSNMIDEGHSYGKDLDVLRQFEALIIKEINDKIKKKEDEKKKEYKEICDTTERKFIENVEKAKENFHKTKK